MGLSRVIVEKERYSQSDFKLITSIFSGKSGVVSGMQVTERQVGSQVFLDIAPGSFIRNDVLYVMRDKVLGDEPYSEHSLEITSFTDEESVSDFASRVGTGVPRLYVVESNTDINFLEKKPVFRIVTELQDTDILIGFRYIKLQFRIDTDPRVNEITVGDPADPEYREYIG